MEMGIKRFSKWVFGACFTLLLLTAADSFAQWGGGYGGWHMGPGMMGGWGMGWFGGRGI